MISRDELAALYDEHADALFAFLLHLTGDPHDTRDILQEIFSRLARKPSTLDKAEDRRRYLLKLAQNLAIDAFRRRDTRARAQDVLSAESTQLFATSPDPDEAKFREELAAALSSLPSDQRVVAHLRLWEGLTFQEIAALLEIPANTAASRYRYALDKLRERLRPLYDEVR